MTRCSRCIRKYYDEPKAGYVQPANEQERWAIAVTCAESAVTVYLGKALCTEHFAEEVGRGQQIWPRQVKQDRDEAI